MRKLLALFAASVAAAAVLAVPPAQAIGPVAGTIALEGTAISPNGDGCMDTARVPVTMSWPSDTYYYYWNVYATGPRGSMSIASGGGYIWYGTPSTGGTFSFNGGWLPEGDYAMRLDMTAYDSYWQGRSFSSQTLNTVRVDRSTPAVTATGPEQRHADISTNVPGVGDVNVDASTSGGVGSSVYAEFSEQIDATISTIRVSTIDGLPVKGSTSYEPTFKRLTFVPETPMAGRYEATAVGIDTACNVGTASWQFTVAAPPMVTAPTVPSVPPVPAPPSAPEPPTAPELPAPPATPEVPPAPPAPEPPAAPEVPSVPAPPAG